VSDSELFPGLLAGLDEFPNVVMPDSESDAASRLDACLELLEEVLRIPEETVKDALKNAEKEMGSIKHIYSHINAMFHCRLVDLPGEKVPSIQAEWKSRAKWVDEVEVDNANISTGHGKIWTLVNSDGKDANKNSGKGGAPAKRKLAVKKEEKGQMKLSFTKSVSIKEQSDVVAVVKSETVVKVAATSSMNGNGLHDEVTAASVTTSTPRKKRRIDISSDEEQ